MKDKPSFDDVELPEIITTPMDGLTDEQWAARNVRQGRIVRRTVAIVVGLAAGSVVASCFIGDTGVYSLAKWLITIGAALLAYALAEREAREPGAPQD